jgi:hypothetical protein
MTAEQTGRFWLCPTCGKHVPARVGRCRCGFERDTATGPVQTVTVQRSTPEAREHPNNWRRAATVLALGGLVAVPIYVSVDAWQRPPPEESELAQEIRRNRMSREPPQVVYVPVPLPSVGDATSPAVPPSTEEVTVGEDAREDEPVEEDAIPPEIPPTEELGNAPSPIEERQESEVERRRRLGTEEFERAMVLLQRKADEADIAWERYVQGCRQNVVSATAVAGVADRDWIAVAGANVTSSWWTEACAEAGTFYALFRQVKTGMCLAEDNARRSFVYPGTRRELRRKYRLDWDGWDDACL